MNYDPNQQQYYNPQQQQQQYYDPNQQQYIPQQQYYDPNQQQYVQTTTTTYTQPTHVVMSQPAVIAPVVTTTFVVDPMYMRARSLLSMGSLLFFFGAVLCIFIITSPIGFFLGLFGFIINVYNFIVHSKFPVARGPATSSLVLAIIEGVFCTIYSIIAIIIIVGAVVGGTRY